ncbi:MAG: asparagine synthetase B, partial [Calditrichota bacterium]
MCGIVGIYNFDKSKTVQQAHLKAMADHMEHRGPDDHGYHISENVGIGMRRLSIIDLGGGHQPIYTQDKKKVIVFNGEVYNYGDHRPELEKIGHKFDTHSDTEVVLHLYEQYGIDFLEKLNGMFGLAIWNEDEKELVIARDRIGIKPVYYYRDGEKIIFAS